MAMRHLGAGLLAAVVATSSASALIVGANGHVHGPGCGHVMDIQGEFTQAELAAQARAMGAALVLGPNEFAVGPTSSSLPGITFILNDIGGVGPGTDARAGFERAAALWSKAFTDPITIRLDVGFSALGPGILGSTGSTGNQGPYSLIRNQILADQTSWEDRRAAASLPAGPSIAFVSNEPPVAGPIDSAQRFLDNNNSFDNNNIRINTANVKALGLVPAYNPVTNPLGRDGMVQFSNLFTWDFDPRDGIAPGAFDFVGVAAHEIGHALGFVSGVDLADVNALPGVAPPGRRGLNNLAWGTSLDLFRYGLFDGVQTLDWSIGGAPCLTIDNGATCAALMSTGRLNGDGRQASHFKDDIILGGLPIGIMDPTATGPGGTRPPMVITYFDLLAFDIIGYDLRSAVPAPAALLLFGLGLAGLGVVRRRA